jgi:hypothetical protein
VRTALILTFLLLPCRAQDSDRDGIQDSLEQALLERFLPRFHLSAGECDQRPAEFTPGLSSPVALTRNGVIYGRVAPHEQTAPGGEAFVEVQFFHLWTRDCGRSGHPLDVEHVTALLSAPSAGAPADRWRALYWYAGAHENTTCENSHAMVAAGLRATVHGPDVYISAGKHASYLSLPHCAAGCGADSCNQPADLAVPRVLNLGEKGVPMNGALWIGHPSWALASKFKSDFPPPLISALEHASMHAVVPAGDASRPVKAVIRAGDSTADALGTASASTDSAIQKADTATGKAVDSAARSTGGALRKAFRATAGFLGLKQDPPAEKRQ